MSAVDDRIEEEFGRHGAAVLDLSHRIGADPETAFSATVGRVAW